MQKGLFITFEGVDGCGKSTQIKKVAEYLEEKGLKVKILREPGGNHIGEKIREILLDTKNENLCIESELLLYLASRAQLVRQEIKNLLENGVTVLCDRFYDSTTAYQGYGRGLDIRLIESLNRFVTVEGKYAPDCTFFVDLTPKDAFERINIRGEEINRMEMADRHFFERVYQGFVDLSNKYPDRICRVDGTKSIDIVFNNIIEKINTMLSVK